MDESVARYKRALEILQRDPASWIALYGAMLVLAIFTFGLGLLLMPNVLRATRDALREERSPDLAAIFVFDDFLEDAIAGGALLVGTMVVGTMAGPISMLVGILLGLAPPTVTEENVGGLDALQLSVAFVQKDPMPVVWHSLMGSLVNLPAVCCLLPAFFTLPVSGIAHWLFYEEHRKAILQIKDSDGAA